MIIALGVSIAPIGATQEEDHDYKQDLEACFDRIQEEAGGIAILLNQDIEGGSMLISLPYSKELLRRCKTWGSLDRNITDINAAARDEEEVKWHIGLLSKKDAEIRE